MSALHTGYRPETFDEVVGQAGAVKALRAVIKSGKERAFLLSGPPGTGKTTLARIAARALGCEPEYITEVDAATNTGIDKMRELKELVRWRAFGKTYNRALIIDECHRLSGQAWDSMLKMLEEPPEHLTWILCTTDLHKVPPAAKRRCVKLQLALVGEADLRKLLAGVMTSEKIRLEREVQDVVIRAAQGSPGQMLMNLATCRAATSRKEAAQLLREAQDSGGVVALCKFLMEGGSWPKAASLLEALADEPPDGIRIAVCNYLGGALKRATSDRQACAILALIEHFAEPFAAGADRAMLTVAVGRALYSGGE